jgi:hypothetical protein
MDRSQFVRLEVYFLVCRPSLVGNNLGFHLQITKKINIKDEAILFADKSKLNKAACKSIRSPM